MFASTSLFEEQLHSDIPVSQNQVWNKHQEQLFTAAAGRQLSIAGDGRADSPGHSAKYGTYTMLDVEDNKVLHVETVQVCTEVL